MHPKKPTSLHRWQTIVDGKTTTFSSLALNLRRRFDHPPFVGQLARVSLPRSLAILCQHPHNYLLRHLRSKHRLPPCHLSGHRLSPSLSHNFHWISHANHSHCRRSERERPLFPLVIPLARLWHKINYHIFLFQTRVQELRITIPTLQRRHRTFRKAGLKNQSLTSRWPWPRNTFRVRPLTVMSLVQNRGLIY